MNYVGIDAARLFKLVMERWGTSNLTVSVFSEWGKIILKGEEEDTGDLRESPQKVEKSIY